MRILLVGDSVLDNDSYVGQNESVASVLQNSMSDRYVDFIISKIAVDGSTTIDVLDQLKKFDFEDYHTVVLSIGGNDLLDNAELLLDTSKSSEWESTFNGIIHRHRLIVEQLRKHSNNLLILNLYHPYFTDYREDFINNADSWIRKFNKQMELNYKSDEIIKLNEILLEETDFTNIIEPSSLGTLKIVETITGKIAN